MTRTKVFLGLLGAFAVLVTPLISQAIQDTPDLIYVLSQPLGLPAEGQDDTLIQNLEVKNIGNAAASQIVVRFNREIESLLVKPFSLSDRPTTIREEEITEVLYPGLPPDATFSVRFEVQQSPVDHEELRIYHSSGRGRDALADGHSLVGYSLMLIFYFLLVIYMFVIGKNEVLTALQLRSEWDQKRIIYRRPPWYVSSKRWQVILEGAENNYVEREHLGVSSPAQLTTYKILTESKPDYKAEADWDRLQEKAKARVCSQLSQYAKDCFRVEQIDPLFELEKPELVAPEDWAGFKSDAARCLGLLIKQSVYQTSMAKDVLNSHRLSWLDGEPKDSVVTFCRSIILADYKRTLMFADDPYRRLRELDTTYLTDREQRELEDDMYAQMMRTINISDIKEAKKFLESEKPQWMNESDYRRLSNTAKTLTDADKAKDKYEGLISSLKGALFDPNFVWDVSEVEGLDGVEIRRTLEAMRNARTRASKLDEEEAALLEEKASIESVKSTIRRQLEIIDQVLSNPDTIEKIEEYDVPFAPGNFDNLKRLAQILREAKKRA